MVTDINHLFFRIINMFIACLDHGLLFTFSPVTSSFVVLAVAELSPVVSWPLV